MAGLKYYASNRLEVLLGQLAEVTRSPLSSPLAGDVIVVQSRGMGRWISLQLAEHSNICMNCEFPFPRTFIAKVLKELFPDADLEKAFSQEAMAWRIYSLLPELLSLEAFATVRTYLDDNEGLKRFQLAQKVANLFDQYLVYRPEMVMRWQRNQFEESASQEWQAILWRALLEGREPMHLGMISELLEKRMALYDGGGTSAFPERVSIFGISSLPPLHLRVIFALSQHCEVNIFELNPSEEYYGEDVSPKYRAKLMKGLSEAALKQFQQQTGNPLLTSLGRLNRDSVEVRLELDERLGFIVQEQPCEFFEPQGDSMLERLQGDLLHARASDPEQEKMHVAAEDHSIRIHSCHSPMRELEVLYDQLLDLFDRDPALKPRDILVMAPDIDLYAPFIEAVFGYPEEASRKIPFSVADRRPSSSNPVIETFLALLALPGGRFTVSEIISLLDREAIRERFGFTDQEIQLIQQWIVGSSIRWGIDGAHRLELDLPALEANTWRAGLKRLLLGYAMPGSNRTLFDNLMPYDEIEGGSGEVLGRFISALEALFAVVSDLPKERTLSEWAAQFDELIEQFFPPGGSGAEGVQTIRVALSRLREVQEEGDPMVEFRVIRYYLSQLLDQTEQHGGFLAGCVTFCALQPMRSIPARVIALLGMGDQNFPRPSHAAGFDLMATSKKCGDRSPREDDRYTFLEALLSARDRLYISYVGRSIANNAEIPPSVLVSELIDYLAQAFEYPGAKTARQSILTEHHLHAFSRRYFDGSQPALFSYSEANAKAADNGPGADPSQPITDFFEKPVPPPSEEMRRVGVRSLIEFFANPSKYFLRHRLGMRLELEKEAFLDTEPFALDALEGYHLKQELVSHGLASHTFGSNELAARGLLPLGEMGSASFQVFKKEADAFCKIVEQERAGLELAEPLLVDFEVDGFRLAGEIDGLYGSPFIKKIQFRCSKLKPKDVLGAWITHLALCASGDRDGENGGYTTVLLGTDEVMRFGPVQNAPDLLAELLAIYWRGLQRPIPFFPASALELAQIAPDGDEVESGGESSVPDKVRQKWEGSKWTGGGEKDDAYFDFCFGARTGLVVQAGPALGASQAESDPLKGEFQELARAVFAPMLQARQGLE